MSSATDAVKQHADGAASEEPCSKRAKVSDSNENAIDKSSSIGTKGNGGTVKDIEKTSTEINKSSAGIAIKTPNKAVNGSTNDNKDSKSDAAEEQYNEDVGELGNLETSFDPKITKALEQVENLQVEICNLNEKASEEILKVEQKFNKLRRPHFEKRNELLKEIPNFWLTSLANHPMIAPMIESAEDEDCLHYMVNLDVEEFEDIKSGYKLKLHFIENPYIANEVIVKEFQILSSEEVESTSTPLEYKDTPQGKRLKEVVESSIAQFRRSRRPGQAQSFFAWLIEPSEPGTDEIAEILKDQIWPNPLEFFFATPEEYGAGTDDESDDDDEELDDEEIDDDEEDGVIAEGIEEGYSEEELDQEDEDDEEDVE